jgi:hypothetical protein
MQRSSPVTDATGNVAASSLGVRLATPLRRSLRQDSGCGKQIFHVVGDVATTVGDGSATFDVALTHYRRSIFGVCRTYGATVGPDATDRIPGTLSF